MQTTPPTDNLDQLLLAIENGNAGEIRRLLSGVHPADIARLLESLTPDQRPLVWEEISEQDVGEVLLEVPDGVREDILKGMDKSALVSAVRDLDIDDIADLYPDLPEDVFAELMRTVDTAARTSLGEVLSYPEDTAGGLMNVDPVAVRENITLQVVQRYLRLLGALPDHTDKLFVINRDNTLSGVLPLSTLLTAPLGDRVSAHTDRTPVTFGLMDSEEQVAESFEKYNLVSAPVLDDDQHLVGRITIDDVVDVMRERADHTVMARAGLKEEEDLFAPVARSARSRAVWLGVNLVTAIIASWVIGLFEATIERLVALAVLMPIVASMGGNAGTQTLTVVIRGLGQGTISSANAWRVLHKEFLLGGLNGMIWAVAVALVATLWYHDYALGAVIALSMVINMVFAALAGVAIPMLLQRIGVDPALAGGVALTTVTDVVGFFSLLGLAALFLV